MGRKKVGRPGDSVRDLCFAGTRSEMDIGFERRGGGDMGRVFDLDGDGAREDASELATMASARVSTVSWDCCEDVERSGGRIEGCLCIAGRELGPDGRFEKGGWVEVVLYAGDAGRVG